MLRMAAFSQPPHIARVSGTRGNRQTGRPVAASRDSGCARR
jgi:hypothetical protein